MDFKWFGLKVEHTLEESTALVPTVGVRCMSTSKTADTEALVPFLIPITLGQPDKALFLCEIQAISQYVIVSALITLKKSYNHWSIVV